jgi:hypothetical protein
VERAEAEYNAQTNSCPSTRLIPPELSLALSAPLTCVDDALVVPLHDSPFHRLLLHAVCQFHGLKSQSNPIDFLAVCALTCGYASSGVDEGSQRVTVVKRTRRKVHHISLAAFVFSRNQKGIEASCVSRVCILVDSASIGQEVMEEIEDWVYIEDVQLNLSSTRHLKAK